MVKIGTAQLNNSRYFFQICHSTRRLFVKGITENSWSQVKVVEWLRWICNSVRQQVQVFTTKAR